MTPPPECFDAKCGAKCGAGDKEVGEAGKEDGANDADIAVDILAEWCRFFLFF